MLCEMNLSATVQSLEEGNARVHVSVNIDASQRFHANLCLVIDVSGSMQLPAALKDREATELSILDIVVHSCRTVIHSLTADDCLAIVTYSDAARVVLPLTPMDDNGKAAAEASLKTLRADGQTNLWQGLETALDLLHAGQRGGSLSSALLLTDGVPNVEPPGGHMEALERYKAAKGGKQLPCTLHTFGFGNDLDSKLLDDLAGASGGCYVFIPDAGFVGTALVNCTACAVTSAGRNAHLNLEGATVTHCWGYADCHAGVVALGALQLGQSKDVVLDIQIPSESEETRLKLQLSFDGPDGPESQEVQITSATSDDAQLWRLQTVELLRELVGLKEGQLAEAREKVRSFVEMLSSAGGGAPSALLEDVQGQVAEAVSREDWYRSWGAHYLRSLSRAHLAQICNNFKDPGVQNYGGELFREVRDLADEIFLKLPPPNPAVRSNVEMLIAMGFPEDEAQRALDYAYNNVEQAATYLMEGMPTHRPAVRPRLAPTPASRVVDMSAYYDASGG